MGKTNIPYADDILSLCMGCSTPCEVGDRCWAKQLCRRMAGRKGFPKDFSQPELFLHRLDEALRWKDLTGTNRPDKPWLNGRPRIIVLNFLGETFDPQLPEDWLDYRGGHLHLMPPLARMAESPHIYIILTKQAQRMAEFSMRHPFPANVWVGVSVTDNHRTIWRVDELRMVQTNGKRLVSFEPILERIRVSLSGIDGIFIGGESGRNPRPCKVEWIQSLADQAIAARIPVFVKQDSGPRPGMQGRIPDELWNRKEMPK